MDHSHHAAMGPTMGPTSTSTADHTASDHRMGHNMMSHSMGHGMGHGMGKGGCKISMLFNLNTIDSCFLSDQWRITSAGMFAGYCIGVFLLGMVLELLRRSVKEYDRFIVRQHLAKFKPATVPIAAAAAAASSSENTSFTCAYILMLLAMYYNGYLLLCIFLGAFFGAFLFQWEHLPLAAHQTSAAQEATVCCG